MFISSSTTSTHLSFPLGIPHRYPSSAVSIRPVLPFVLLRSDVNGLARCLTFINTSPAVSRQDLELQHTHFIHHVSYTNVAYEQTCSPRANIITRLNRWHSEASMQGLRQVSIEEEQMRWLKSMLPLQGR